MVSLKDILKYYGQNQEMLVCLVVGCILVLFDAWKTRREQSIRLSATLVFPSALLLVLVLNPVSAHFALKLFHDSQVQRFLWIVPMPLLLAVLVVLLLGKIRSVRWRGAAFGVACCTVLIISAGFPRLRTTWESDTDNWYKVPQIVVELCDCIMEDESPKKSAIFPFPLNLWVRQYTADIQIPFSWNSIESNPIAEKLYELYGETTDDEAVDLDELARLARDGGFTYIIVQENGQYTGNLATNGYREVCRVDTCPEHDSQAYCNTYILYRQE